MDQLRWFWLALFLVSVTWLVMNFLEFKQARSNGTYLSQSEQSTSAQSSSTENQSAQQSTEIVDDVPEIIEDDQPEIASVADIVSDEEAITIETDEYFMVIGRGGSIERSALKKYPISIENKGIPTELFSKNRYMLQTGLSSHGEAPNHNSPFTSPQKNYKSVPGQILEVPLTWQKDGIKVTKTFIFKPDSYAITVNTTIENSSEENWQGNPYAQIMRKRPPDESQNFIYTYSGPAVYTPEDKYQKIDFDDIEGGNGQTHESLNRDVTDSWLAMLQHYFLSAIIPNPNETVKLYARKIEDRFYVGYRGQKITVAPSSVGNYEQTFFVGPTEQKRLVEVHEALDFAVDYGVFHVIAAPVFWLLKNIQSWVGNWGFSIIIVTLLIKLLFFKLSEKSYRSMAKLRKLTPRIQQLKERYGDDKQALNKKMMSIYKEEKVNPLGGCLPVLVQIPVFISLYWVLIESVELRQAPFILWIHDLSIADPYFILPLMMGISMWFQQRLNPAPTDPIQAKVMQFLPVVFTVFFLFFPAGLVVYWVTNNILSIAQQWAITKRVERGE